MSLFLGSLATVAISTYSDSAIITHYCIIIIAYYYVLLRIQMISHYNLIITSY